MYIRNLFLVGMVACAQAVTIGLFGDEECDDDFLELPDGNQDVCFDIDLNVCCGTIDVGGQSVTASFGSVTPVVDANLEGYAQQGDDDNPPTDPCAVFVSRTEMNDDANEYVCLSEDSATFTGGKVIASSRRARRGRTEARWAAPNGYGMVLNNTIHGVYKDSALGKKYAKLTTREEKRAFLAANAERREPVHIKV